MAAVGRGVAGGGAPGLDGWRLRTDISWLFMSRRCCCPLKNTASPEKLPPKSQEAGEQAPFEVEQVPCSGLFKVPYSWSIARACLQEMRSTEGELSTTAQ